LSSPSLYSCITLLTLRFCAVLDMFIAPNLFQRKRGGETLGSSRFLVIYWPCRRAALAAISTHLR
jgi:hypothetical protein